MCRPYSRVQSVPYFRSRHGELDRRLPKLPAISTEKYPGLDDGALGEVVTTEQVIDLTEGSQPVRKLPYSAGPGNSEVVRKEVDKMLKFGVIEKETTPWEYPVVLATKNDGTYLF